MSAFADVAAIAPQRIWEGVAGRVVHGDRLTLAVVELDPNSVVPEHRHHNEQVGVLLGGSLRFRVDDEERELLPGGTWCIPGGVPHEVVTGPGGAFLVETFAPPREDWDDLDRLAPRPPPWFEGDAQPRVPGRRA
jgi:quercetin dioxygenase-like cupin family protein